MVRLVSPRRVDISGDSGLKREGRREQPRRVRHDIHKWYENEGSGDEQPLGSQTNHLRSW